MMLFRPVLRTGLHSVSELRYRDVWSRIVANSLCPERGAKLKLPLGGEGFRAVQTRPRSPGTGASYVQICSSVWKWHLALPPDCSCSQIVQRRLQEARWLSRKIPIGRSQCLRYKGGRASCLECDCGQWGMQRRCVGNPRCWQAQLSALRLCWQPGFPTTLRWSRWSLDVCSPKGSALSAGTLKGCSALEPFRFWPWTSFCRRRPFPY